MKDKRRQQILKDFERIWKKLHSTWVPREKDYLDAFSLNQFFDVMIEMKKDTAKAIFDDLEKLISQELLESAMIEDEWEELKKKWVTE